MSKTHLDLFALAVRLLEGFRIGQRTDMIGHIFVDVTGNFAHDRRRAFGLQGAARAIALAGPVVNDVTLIDIARAGQFRAIRANIDIALFVEDEVRSAKGAIGACRLAPHRNVRRDLAIH